MNTVIYTCKWLAGDTFLTVILCDFVLMSQFAFVRQTKILAINYIVSGW